jgi:ankyrin repeat protein
VALLVKEGTDVNKKDNLGMTPLLEALRGGHDAAAQILVANGAKPLLKVCQSMSILAEPDLGSGLCTRVKPQGGAVPKIRA